MYMTITGCRECPFCTQVAGDSGESCIHPDAEESIVRTWPWTKSKSRQNTSVDDSKPGVPEWCPIKYAPTFVCAAKDIIVQEPDRS